MLEDEENEPMLLVLGVLAAVLAIVIWWFISSGQGVSPVSAVAPTTTAESVATLPSSTATTAAPDLVQELSAVSLTIADGITLDGTVRSSGIADAMLAEAVSQFGAENVTNNLVIDPVVTEAGGTVTVIGTVVGERSKDLVMDAFGTMAVELGYTVDDQVIVEALAPSDVLVDVSDVGIRFTGSVPSSATSDEFEAFGLTLNEQVDNQLMVDPATTTLGGEVRFVGDVGTPSEVNEVEAAFEVAFDHTGYGVTNELDSVTTELEASLSELFALDPIEFDSGQTAIRASEEAILDQAADVLAANPTGAVEVQGHTDNEGDPAYNLGLSQRRADAVRDYLIAQGVDPERVTAVGYGPDEPIADNSTAPGRQANRRIVFVER